MIYKTSNPVLNEKRFRRANIHSNEHMTVEGTAQKTLLLFAILLIPAIYVWKTVFSQTPEVVLGYTSYIIPIVVITLILGITIMFKPHLAKWLAIAYAGIEGLLIGLVSAIFEIAYPGIVLQAVSLTFGVALIMFIIYSNEIIKVTNKLRIGIISATGAIGLFYLISFISSMLGFTYFGNLLNGTSWISIGISGVIVVVAAFNLLMDFDFIKRATREKFDKQMEWFGAFGLMVTLIWLYLELLRLLGKLNRR